jgi:hypothetical protein
MYHVAAICVTGCDAEMPQGQYGYWNEAKQEQDTHFLMHQTEKFSNYAPGER